MGCLLAPSVRATGAVDRGGPCTSDQLELARQSPCWGIRGLMYSTLDISVIKLMKIPDDHVNTHVVELTRL